MSISFLGASVRFETKIHKLIQDSVEIIVSQEVAELMKSSGYEMISGALYIRGKTFQFHYGKLSNGKKPDTNTLFEIGSVTKTHTGLLLSQAVYDKKVNLDEDIRTYIEGSYPNLIMSNGQPITLRHLITHTSGLPMNINCIGFGQKIEEQLSCFKSFSSKAFFQALKEIKLKDNSHEKYNILMQVSS
ncbi:serine hydrolase domain-containing protein [Elizabethkingia occulta]|uniref:serine hydrolase domain-containing protein n=1 Tax=Elizabethkingia occulta TaxID=1867263 RepID=UPI00398C25DC